MEDNRGSNLVNTLLDNYEEPLDIRLISNNPFIPLIGNNFNTPTNQNNEKRHIPPESTPKLPLNRNNKQQALGSLKRNAEMKQQNKSRVRGSLQYEPYKKFKRTN